MTNLQPVKRKRLQFSMRILMGLLGLAGLYLGSWEITRSFGHYGPLGGDSPLPLMVRRNVVVFSPGRGKVVGSQWYLWLFGVEFRLPITSDPAAGTRLSNLDRLKLTVAELRSQGKQIRVNLSHRTPDAETLRWLAQLRDLQVLHLDSSGIDDAGIALLSQSRSLRRITLNHTALTEEGLKHLACIKTLEDLSVRAINRSNPMTDSDAIHLAKLDRLCKLDLSANSQLSDDTLKWVGRLPRLRWLSLWRVPITGKGLEELARCRTLQTLQLGGTRIHDDDLRHLRSLHNLRTLDLPSPAETFAANPKVRPGQQQSRMQFGVKGPGLRHLWGLPIEELGYPLRRGDLSYWAGLARLRTLGPHAHVVGHDLVHLRRMSNLRRLEIRLADWGNAAELTALASLRKLTDLTIRSGRITELAAGGRDPGAGLSVLQQLPQLERLELSGIDDDALIHLAGCVHLKTLDLRSTAVTGTGLKQLRRLTRLRALRLNGRILTDSGIEELEHFDSIRHLVLGDGSRAQEGIFQYYRARQTPAVAWSPRGLAKLSRCRSLESLDLSGLPITDEVLVQLAHLPQLKQLHLEDTHVGNAGVAALRQLDTLETLHLQRTQVGDKGVLPLADLPHLEMLDVIETDVSWSAGKTIYEARGQRCHITDNWCCGCMAFRPPSSGI